MANIIFNITAHEKGYTCLSYDTNGEFLVTGGSDGKVKIWESFDDESPEVHNVGEKVNALVCQDQHFIPATESTLVQKYQVQGGLTDGVATRFTAEVNHLAINKDQTLLAAGASDFLVKVMNLSSNGDQDHDSSYKGHTGPVLSVSLDPLDVFVAASSCDGMARVWRLDSKHEVTAFRACAPCNDPTLALSPCRLTWEPMEGKILAIAVDREVRLYERNTWQVLCFLSTPLITQPILDMTFSSDAKFLVAGTKDGWLLVWEVDSRELVFKYRHPKVSGICTVLWHPRMEMVVVFADVLGRVSGIQVEPKTEAERHKASLPQTVPSSSEQLTSSEIADLMGDADDDLLQQAANQFEANKAADSDIDDDVDADFDLSQIKASFLDPDDDDADDAGLLTRTDSTSQHQKLPPTPVVMKPPSRQKAFQPGSVPPGGDQHFMLWNRVGVVTQFDTSDEQSIEVEFHDTTFHHSLHINNPQGYTLADLNQHAVALASQIEGDDPDQCSRVMVRPLTTSLVEWSVNLPAGESALAVTLVGKLCLVVATDADLLRVFSIAGGIQTGLFSIPGPVVSLAGHGKQVMVVCHQPWQGQLVALIQLEGSRSRDTMMWQPLPVAKKASLSWIGFTEVGTPITADDSGHVRALSQPFSSPGCWVPLVNLRATLKQSVDNYFLVGVLEATQQLEVIFCRASPYPHTLPRPLVSLLPFQMPVCHLDTEQGKLEEEFLRSRAVANFCRASEAPTITTSDEDGDLASSITSKLVSKQKAVLLKMFALSLKLEEESRAMEVARLMPDASTVQLAIRYAGQMRRLQLVERLSDLARQKELEADQCERDDETSDSSSDEDEPRPLRERLLKAKQASTGDNEESSSEEEESGDEESEKVKDKTVEKSQNISILQSDKKVGSVRPGLSKNPFRNLGDSQPVTQLESLKSTPQGTKVFDSLHKDSPSSVKHTGQHSTSTVDSNRVASGKKQATLFGKAFAENVPPKAAKKVTQKKSKPSDEPIDSFTDWLDQSRPELEEEFPEKSAEEIFDIGKDRFAKLDLKEVENNKTKSVGRPKKRKQTDTVVSEEQSQKRQSLSKGTKLKLNSFAFES